MQTVNRVIGFKWVSEKTMTDINSTKLPKTGSHFPETRISGS